MSAREATSMRSLRDSARQDGQITESVDVIGNGPDRASHSRELTDSDSWCTPRDLAADLGAFDIDPCSNARSHIAATRALTLANGDDGLTAVWVGTAFVNPPYSQPLPWCRRLAAHASWAALLKLDTTTRWFAELVACGARWAPFRARLRFERPDKPPMVANFASVLFWRGWNPPQAVRDRLWMDTVDVDTPADVAAELARLAAARGAALEGVVGIVKRINGWLGPDDQRTLRAATALLEGQER